MPILKLKPAYKDNLWGGHRLVDEFNKDYDGPVLAESWEVSCYPGSPSVIAEGRYAGISLEEYINDKNPDAVGTAGSRFAGFPLMVKLIDARESLSVQVHPSDGYAYAYEGQPGKLEVWYIVDAEPGACIYYGVKKRISKANFKRHIENNTLEEILYKAPAKKGDVFFIGHGVLHAIGAGIVVLEVEQNSNVTYRVYDYGRKGPDGKERELHIKKALDVVQLEPALHKDMHGHLADCEYFVVDRLCSDEAEGYGVLQTGQTVGSAPAGSGIVPEIPGGSLARLFVGTESFMTITFIEGEGVILTADDRAEYRKGDSFFLPAGTGEVLIEGRYDVILARI
ncbi:MAG: class I mannose-6-phosphate isomerase [Lachnospiraceae bacterium]|nr:class I mannose-6-phosphate isomerase [Lachnospiraceae bacterium]